MNSDRARRHRFSKKSGVNTAIVIFNAILIGVLWNVVFGLVQTERQDEIRAAIDRNDNLAIAFEQYTVRTIESANGVIQQLIRAYVSSGRTMDLEKFVADFTIDDKAIIGVVLADENGTAKSNAYLGSSVKPINVADREHFSVHIEHDSGNVFVGKPVVGRITGQWIIPVTRRINKADGTFGGVAMALIEPARFTDVLHDAKLRPLDIFSLVGLDGVTRARLKGTTVSWGEDISKSPLFAEQAKRPNGNYSARGQLDNVPRFFSYRTLPDYQVMTTVGAAEADVLAEFYERRKVYFWAAGLTSLVIAGFAALLMLALASQRRAAAIVARSHARFLATFNQAAVGIAHSDLDGRYLAVNQKLCEILGYSEKELLARTFADITHPDDIASSAEFRRNMIAELGDVKFVEREKRYIRKDGAVVWCAVTISAVHDRDDNFEYFAAVIQDISERKRTGIRIQHLNRVNAVLSGINALIVRVRDRDELFREACAIAVGKGQFPFAWIGILDPATQDVTPAAWAGENAEELTRAKSSAHADSPRGQGAVGRAIRERRAVSNNDIRPDHVGGPRQQEILRLGFRSQITLPLYEDHTVVGALTMYAREPEFFDEKELGLLAELAGNISFALENISTQQKLGKLARIRAVSSKIDNAIIRVHDREALLREAYRIVVDHGKFEMVWIAVLDWKKQRIYPVAWRGFSAETALALSWATIAASRGTLGEAMRTRKLSCRNDIDASMPAGKLREEALKNGHRSTVCLPIVENDNVVALVALYATGSGFFDEEELSLLAELAGNISFAFENIGRQQKLDKLARIRAVSGEINTVIIRVHDREALLREACRIFVEHGQFELVWTALIDQAKQKIQPVAWAGFSSEIAHAVDWKAISVAGVTLAEVIQTRKLAVRNDIGTEARTGVLRREAVKMGCRSTVCLPLVVGDTVVAAVILFAAGTDFFDKEELKLLNEVAANVSFALEHIEKNEKIDHLSRIQAVMGSINALIVRARDRDELFTEACRIAVEQGGFRMSLIATVDRSSMKIDPVASAGKDEELLTAIKDVLSSSEGAPNTMVARAIREKKAVVSNDSKGDSRVVFGRKYAESGVRSMAVLPLIVSDEAVGVLALYSEEMGFFDEEEFKLLTELASDIAFAIDHIDKQERLDYLAYYDVLTGLANRSLFLERVAQYIRSAAGGGHKLALFLLDLERFKNINDSLGRPAGDALLKQVAEWLTRNAGDANLLARLGADHFAMVLPEVKQEGDVARLLEKSMAAFLNHPFRLNDAVFRIAAKVGVAQFPDDGADADTLFRNAEAALKKAKAGGDRYLFHTQKMTATVAGQLTLENQLRQALDNEEFVLHYQPKVNLRSGMITGAEALIRWNDPRTGLVPPGRFIPILEETGLIYEVGRWALKKAIEDYLRWRSAGLAAVRIAVNVSPLQLRNRGFTAEIKQAIGIDVHAATGLELEITESLIMKDVQHNIASLQAIRDMGVTIAVDDFGTGFSSLSYLAKLPVDTLKIDRSFVIEMTAESDGLALVSTIIKLAHSLSLKVVAEGVETEEQSRLLRLLICDEMQGFLFSKPVPAEIFETRFLVPVPVTRRIVNRGST